MNDQHTHTEDHRPHPQPERTEAPRREGVSGLVVALLAAFTLLVGLLSGLVLGATGGFLFALATERDGPVASEHARAVEPLREATAPAPTATSRPMPTREAPTAMPPAEEQTEPAPSGAEEGYPGPEDASPEQEVPGLDAFGSFELRPFLGVLVEDVPGEDPSEVGQGARVVSVEPGTPAEEVGLQVGDLVLAVDDAPVTNAADLVAAIGEAEVGQTVSLRLRRDDQEMEVGATLGGRLTAEISGPGGSTETFRLPLNPDDPAFEEFLRQLPPELEQRYREMAEQYREMLEEMMEEESP